MSMISTNDLAVERISVREIEGTPDSPDGEVKETCMTPA